MAWWEHAALAVSLSGHVLAGMAMFLPPPRAQDGAPYRVLYAFCNALNRGYARNAAQPEPKAPQP